MLLEKGELKTFYKKKLKSLNFVIYLLLSIQHELFWNIIFIIFCTK